MRNAETSGCTISQPEGAIGGGGPPSPHYSRTQLANTAGLMETFGIDGPARIKHPWGISTPHPSRGTRARYPVRLAAGVIPAREWPWACKPGLFTVLS